MTSSHRASFEAFLSQLTQTNATLSFFSDFGKISRNVANISIDLHTLNYLIGKSDLRQAVEELWMRDSRVFESMDILVATRRRDNKTYINTAGQTKLLHSLFRSVDGVVEFLEETGLAEVLRNSQIKDLHDYVFGVETGLDSNARKNRSGNATEKLISSILTAEGIPFEEQVSSQKYPALTEALGVDRKVFDFVVETPARVYVIEVNYYSANGSKLNEVARSYTDIAPKINAVAGFEFVWITDGQGWLGAKNKLQEAYNAIPSVYNFATLPHFIRCIKE